jgi:hypothetical protein
VEGRDPRPPEQEDVSGCALQHHVGEHPSCHLSVPIRRCDSALQERSRSTATFTRLRRDRFTPSSTKKTLSPTTH